MRRPVQAALLAVAYLAVARLGLAGSPPAAGVPLVWPNAGLALSALLLWGPGLWPGVLLGSLLATVTTGAPLMSIFLVPAGNTLAAFVGAKLLRRSDRWRPGPQRLSSLATFAGLGVAIPAAISTTVSTGAHLFQPSATWSTAVEPWSIGWLAEASAIALLAPLFIRWRSGSHRAYRSSQRVEAGLLFLLITIISIAVFILGTAPLEAIYLLFPFLSWVALRFAVREAAVAALLTGIIAEVGALSGTSPLGIVAPGYGIPATWAYVILSTSLAALLATAMEQRKLAHSALSGFLEGVDQADAVDAGQSGDEVLPALDDVHSTRQFAVMVMVVVTAPVFLILYEWSRSTFLAQWPDWLTYVVAAVVGSVAAAIVAYVTLKRQSNLYERIVHEIVARQRVEEMRQELAQQTARLERSAEQLKAEIAERRQAESALRQSEERNRALVRAIPDLMFLLDRAGTFIDYYDADHDLYMPPEEFVGRRLDELFPADFSAPFQKLIRNVRESGEVQLREYSLESEGVLRHYEARLAPAGDDQILAIVRDITDRKTAEEGLLKEKLLSESLIDTLPGIFALIDAQGHLRLWNKNLESFSGHGADQLAQLSALAFFDPEDHDFVQAQMARVLEEGRANTELDLLNKQGEKTPYFLTGRRIILEGEPHILSMALNITDRKQAEQALRESEQRYRLLFRHSPLGILHFDETGSIVDCNGKFVDIIGSSRDAIIGLEMLTDLEDEAIKVAVQSALAGEVTFYEDEYRSITADKTTPVRAVFGPVSAGEGTSLGGVGIVEDVTERKRTEAALQRKQKLESLGILAGGIAHDFNNLLVAMLGQASLALSRLAPESAARANVEKVVTAAERAADLTRQLLAYSGRGQFERLPIQLNSLITENLHLFEVAIHKQIKLKAVLDDALPMIEADAGQMQQVIMNLILNAAEAIGEGSGTVTVTTGLAQVRAGERHIWHHGLNEMPPAIYVVLGVHDDGCGMDETTLSRIFDPFFTTKFTGRGLGLAAVLGIVRGHKAGLKVESRPDEGTSFFIYLPVVAEEAPTGSGLDETAGESGNSCGPILVIDDEAAVRQAVRDILDMEGLQTLMAQDGQSGLSLYSEYAGEIELVILDLSMPGMGGLQVLQTLREMDADVPVLLSSGYAESEIMEDLEATSQVTFIQKPYSAKSLVNAVQRLHKNST